MSKPTIVYVLGQITGDTWDLQGIFSNETLAVANCPNEHFFVAPVEMDVALPVETTEWPGLYFPAIKFATEYECRFLDKDSQF